MGYDNGYHVLNFNSIKDMGGTQPISFSFYGTEVSETEWSKLFVDLLWTIYKAVPQAFDKLVNDERSKKKKAWLVGREDIVFLNEPQAICTKYWVETAIPPTVQMERLKLAIESCHLDLDKVNIIYKCVGSEGRYKRKDKEDFYNWLTLEKGIDRRTSESFISALRTVERYSREKEYISAMVYDLDTDELNSLLLQLKKDEHFTLLVHGYRRKYERALEILKDYNEEKTGKTTDQSNSSSSQEKEESEQTQVFSDIRANKDAYGTRPFFEQLTVNPDDYADVRIGTLDLPFRLENRLLGVGIDRLSVLLKKNRNMIAHINGLGQGSVKEIDKLLDSFDTRVNRARIKQEQEKTNCDKTSTATDDYTSIAELYGLNPAVYEGDILPSDAFSVRAYNCLNRAGIRTVDTLIKYSFSDLYQIRGFGQLCKREIDSFIRHIGDVQFERAIPESGVKVSDELLPYIDYLKEGDFSFLDAVTFSNTAMQFINRCREAYQDLGPELVEGILTSDESAVAIYELLSEYTKSHDATEKCKRIISSIPKQLLETNASRIIHYYSDYESVTAPLLELISNLDDNLEQYLIANSALVASSNSSLHHLIDWCSFDINSAVSGFFDNLSNKERSIQVINMRASGHTLEETGSVFNVTRERVRQIEKKAVNVFGRWQNRNGLVKHLLLALEEDNAFSSSEAISYFEEYGVETVYLLRNCKTDDYTYDKQLDLFIFDDQSLIEKIQTFIDGLPDAFDESGYAKAIKTATEDYNYPENMVQAILNDSYGKTGNVYHRSRLTQETIYTDILTRFFPDGIHVYSEQQKIRELVLEEYGIDLSDKTDRAIENYIARFCILRGRGVYKVRDNTTVISDQLANKIKEYINNSPVPVFMTNTLYAVFEEELNKEGIDNKYYLQGLLRDRFDDEWIFRRDYISKDARYTSIGSSIVEYIRKSKHPVKKEDIQNAFPGVTEIVINFATNDSNVINLFGSYIHSNILHFSWTDKEYLKKALTDLMGEKGYCSCHDLYDYISRDYKEILTNNFITIPYSLFSVLEYLFREEYRFNRPFISREDAVFEKPIEILNEIIRDSVIISIQEISALAKEYKVHIPRQLEYFDSLNDTHLLLDGFNLASISYIGVDKYIAKVVEAFIFNEITEATPITQLNCVSSLPAINVQWNAWLIYSVLKKWSDKLIVFPSDNQFRKAYPIVSHEDGITVLPLDDNLSHDGTIHTADDLTNIDELIESYLTEELGVE